MDLQRMEKRLPAEAPSFREIETVLAVPDLHRLAGGEFSDDLGGNVWEWCEDWHDASQKDRVARGASWRLSGRGILLPSHRRLGGDIGTKTRVEQK